MKITHLFVALILTSFFTQNLLAQTCGSGGNILLTSQGTVNDLAASSCTTVGGTLFIQGADITDLSGLEKLTSVGADVLIQNNAVLTNLDGLQNIGSVAGSVTVFGNAMVTNLNGLRNINSFDGNLIIQNNAMLANLDGLQSIDSVAMDLRIENNGLITNLDGLRFISTVGRDLLILDNAALTNLDGLRRIVSVSRDIIIQNNAQLTNINGLQNLTSIGRTLAVRSNIQLNEFCGLHTLFTSPDNGISAIDLSGNGSETSEPDIVAGGNCRDILPVGVINWVVTKLDDTDDALCGADCSLREAIFNTNANPGSTITFAAGLTGTITLEQGQLTVTESVDIIGPGADVLTVSGNNAGRVFFFDGATTSKAFELSGLTIADGLADLGGGLNFTGSPVIDDSLRIVDCEFRDNYGSSLGDNLYATYVAGVDVSGSTFVNTTAAGSGRGHSVAMVNATAAISNSTFGGGGNQSSIYLINTTGLSANAVIKNSTFSGINGRDVHALRAESQFDGLPENNTLRFGNNVFSGYSGTLVLESDERLDIASEGYNVSDGASPFLVGPGDQPETDPLLGDLRHNGGPTRTIALASGSPAVDAGDCSGGTVNVDQRGVPRASIFACDAGAFERSTALSLPDILLAQDGHFEPQALTGHILRIGMEDFAPVGGGEAIGAVEERTSIIAGPSTNYGYHGITGVDHDTAATLEQVYAGTAKGRLVLRNTGNGSVERVLMSDLPHDWNTFTSGVVRDPVNGNLFVPLEEWQALDSSPVAGVPADGRDKVLELDPNGKLVRYYNGDPAGPADWNPDGVVLDPVTGEVLIASYFLGTISRFSRSGSEAAYLGQLADLTVNQLAGLTLDPDDGRIFACEFSWPGPSVKIFELANDGAEIRAFGVGPALNALQRSTAGFGGCAVAPGGRFLAVVDFNNDEVLIFDTQRLVDDRRPVVGRFAWPGTSAGAFSSVAFQPPQAAVPGDMVVLTDSTFSGNAVTDSSLLRIDLDGVDFGALPQDPASVDTSRTAELAGTSTSRGRHAITGMDSSHMAVFEHDLGTSEARLVVRGLDGGLSRVVLDGIPHNWASSFASGFLWDEINSHFIVTSEIWESVGDSPIPGVPADGRSKVIELDASGSLVRYYNGDPGGAAIWRPDGAAIHPFTNELLSASYAEQAILRFQRSGSEGVYLGKYDLPLTPSGLAVEPNDGRIFVTEWTDNRITELSPAGQVVRTFDISDGQYPRQFSGADFAPGGRFLAVTDFANAEVLVLDTNSLDGNGARPVVARYGWADGTYYSFSSVAFVRSDYTPVIAATSEHSDAHGNLMNLINGSGLSGNGPVHEMVHDNEFGAFSMWHAGVQDAGLGGPTGNPPPTAEQEIVFNLGAARPVLGAWVWNHNQAGKTERGVHEMQILVSSDTNLRTAGFTPVGTFELAEASGGLEPAQFLSFTADNARWVKFDIQSAHSGNANEYVGLSEVRFVYPPVIFGDSFESGAPAPEQ